MMKPIGTPPSRKAVPRRSLLRWMTLAILPGVLLGVWVFYKPIRALAPQLVGLTCSRCAARGTICVDDTALATEAAALYDLALQFVNSTIGSIEHPPRVIFCSTDSCYHAFGLDKPTAHTTPFGIIVSPRGWLPHYVRHEMIHHLQSERLGFWSLGPVQRWRSPAWFVEGMAYALSEDPRPELVEPYQGYRLRFQAWYQAVGKERLWEAARVQ